MTTSTSEIIAPPRRINPQRLAWGVLLISFAVFCAICIVTGVGVNYFLFQSTVPMVSSVRVGRGTASMQGSADSSFLAVQDEGPLVNSTLVKTDAQSQATLFFRDTTQDNRLIAAVTLKPGASITFNQASRPRFDWSTVGYMIDLGDISGDIDVYVPQDVRRRFRLSMQTPGGAWVYLTDSGQYTVSATDSRVQVINNAGNATLIAADRQSARSIPVGQKGILPASGGDITLIPGYSDLLQNSIFDTGDLGAWGCAPGPYDQAPQSHDGIETIDGLSALRLVRDDTEAHGEIFCTQTFGPVGQVGLDVSGYSYLELKITFYVKFQSLDLCGTKGSECPLTLRLNYIDNSSADGELRNWIHGFYTRSDSQLNYPTRCDSCILDHELVNSNAWYTYDSGNLLSQIPTNQEPRQLNNIQFYASGHRFDVFVNSVVLLAGQASSEVSNDSVSSQPTAESGS